MSERICLPGGQWRLWEQFALRGPGFATTGVLRMVPDGLIAAAGKFAAETVLAGAEWDTFDEQFGEAMVQNALQLQQIATQPAFRAAVAWQNPAVLDRVLGLFVAWEPTAAGRTSKRREREELVAHYWQRFCVKNDTIGFFGPVGWGSWQLSQPGLRVLPGTGLVAESNIYFSSWAVDAVARTIGTDPRLREWIAPRRVAFINLDGVLASMPGRPAQQLSPVLREVLGRCDGANTPPQLAEQVTASIGRVVPRTEVMAALEELVARRLIVWRLEVPTCAHPERYLRTALERLADPMVRQDALARLEILERGRERVAAAGHDADVLSQAFTALETDFEKLTEVAAQRAKGKRTAPCRSLIYSDCRRSATVELGSEVLAALTPLTLCLTAARWMTSRFAEVVGARIRQAYLALAEQHETVNLAALWMKCLPVPHGDSIADIDAIQAELHARWAVIIAAPDGVSQVRLSSADISAQVERAFGEHGSAWPQARYFSPDVMIVANDLAEVARGNFEIVLGELHVAMNTISTSLWVMQHPDAEQLLAETAIDFTGPRLLPMLPKEQPPRWSARSRISLDRPEDYYVALVDYTGDPHRERTVLSADVQVRLRDDQLVAVLPDGAVFDAMDVFSNAMTNRVMDRFSLRTLADHSPRVTVDRLVVARESWCFGVADIGFVAEKVESRRFVLARRWREAMGLPRFVFVVSPTEPRPFYVDFDAPVYVNIFAKAVRRLARQDPVGRLVVTEMLPTPDQAWLVDDQGNRYTSELRFVAVDQDEVGRPTIEGVPA